MDKRLYAELEIPLPPKPKVKKSLKKKTSAAEEIEDILAQNEVGIVINYRD